MISAEKSVYISYSWGAEKRHPLVDELLAALAAKGIEVKRDSSAVQYGDSIRAYMNELAAGRAIILVLSDEYFKSPNCMYELREIYLNSRKEFRKRIFPVVLKGTKFHKTIDRIPYIRHWEEETEKLKAALDTVARENIGSVSHNELRDYAAFRQIIDELLALLGDMNHLTEEDHLKTGFAALIDGIFSGNSPSCDGGEHQASKKMESNIHQKFVGSGNIVAGSGDVHVTHLHIAGPPPPSSAASPESKNYGFSRSNSLKRDINDLQQQRDLLSDKLNRLQKQRIIETRAEEKFRLEQLIQDAQAECDAIDQKLDMLHNQQ